MSRIKDYLAETTAFFDAEEEEEYNESFHCRKCGTTELKVFDDGGNFYLFNKDQGDLIIRNEKHNVLIGGRFEWASKMVLRWHLQTFEKDMDGPYCSACIGGRIDDKWPILRLYSL